MFEDVDHHTKFGINIVSYAGDINFYSIANLFHPNTIGQCFQRDDNSSIPGIKSKDNKWELRGHPKRLTRICESELEVFSELYDFGNTPFDEARLPAVHAQPLVDVLKKLAKSPYRLENYREEIFITQHWNEADDQNNGVIRRETRFPVFIEDLVISGPHFYVANPINKTPRSICRVNADYDVVDIKMIDPGYLPRTNYVPACDRTTYAKKSPKVPWGNGALVTDFYRLLNREMVGPTAERTLITALLPPGPAHLHTCLSTTCASEEMLLVLASVTASLPYDFYVKSIGTSHVNMTLLRQLPIISMSNSYIRRCFIRTMLLQAVTQYYEELWYRVTPMMSSNDMWLKSDARLSNALYEVSSQWSKKNHQLSDYCRRQLMVEIDVLVARALEISIEELVEVYRIQFPVLQYYEANTWYDRNGNIVFTVNRGMPGVGMDRNTWEDVKDMKYGNVEKKYQDETMVGGPISRTLSYVAPFDRCDREADYRICYNQAVNNL
jgi:hypothetical protein